MAGYRPNDFGYAHSEAIMAGLKARVRKNTYISDGYTFLDKPGEYKEFEKMLQVARQGDHDMLYVDTVKEFAGESLADFKAMLTAIYDAGMLVTSLTEPHYKYHDFMAAIEVLEDLMPVYRMNRQSITAAVMYLMGNEISHISQYTGLSEADVLQAAADYKREQEQEEE